MGTTQPVQQCDVGHIPGVTYHTHVLHTRRLLRSTGGFRRPLHSLTKKNLESNKMRMNESHREVHGFQCKLATCKCQELHGLQKQPGRRMYAACMDEVKRTEKEQCTGKPFALHTTSTIFVGRADVDLYVHFENTASCICARRHAGVSQLRLLACVVALRSARSFAACCAG